MLYKCHSRRKTSGTGLFVNHLLNEDLGLHLFWKMKRSPFERRVEKYLSVPFHIFPSNIYTIIYFDDLMCWSFARRPVCMTLAHRTCIHTHCCTPKMILLIHRRLYLPRSWNLAEACGKGHHCHPTPCYHWSSCRWGCLAWWVSLICLVRRSSINYYSRSLSENIGGIFVLLRSATNGRMWWCRQFDECNCVVVALQPCHSTSNFLMTLQKIKSWYIFH